MSTLLDKAIEAVSKLPPEQQDAIARDMLDRIDADERWDHLLQDPRSDFVVKGLVDQARAEISQGEVVEFDPAARPR